MNDRVLALGIRVIAALFALLYLQSTYDFIVNHHVSFMTYTAVEPMAQWAVANLGARLLGIALGFLIALALRNDTLLALMFAVRLCADVTDFWISTHTPGAEAMVGWILLAFFAIEALCLAALLKHQNLVLRKRI
ncbi:MAG: hypothetical protein U1E15_05705 [Hyphomicrobiales bacterium]